MGMSQEGFVDKYEGRWHDFEDMLHRIENDNVGGPVDDFPQRYRQICRHLAVARSRGYSPGVRARLEKMVQRGHTILYQRHKTRAGRRIWRYVAGGFAADVRDNWKFLTAALLFFFVPWLVVMGWVMASPQMAAEILGPMQVHQLDSMYGAERVAQRGAGDDLRMFGFYVYNNVGIALRTFGAGIAFGIGSLAILVFNGVVLGASSGYVEAAGYGDQFWPFVIGHGSLELTAIALAGMAGLKIGAAPLWPGRRSRIDALRKAAKDSVGIIVGFSVMLVLAAFVEAFWSPRDIEPIIRSVVGGGLWALVVGYFALAGRGYESR